MRLVTPTTTLVELFPEMVVTPSNGELNYYYIPTYIFLNTRENFCFYGIIRLTGRRPSPCPWGYMELDCRCYQVFNKLKTFSMSEQFCQEQGGTLAMPRTERIQDFLEVLMQQSDKLSFWIGIYLIYVFT